MIELAESMNIRIVASPAYSPWSNGLVERHNATLAETLYKVHAECKDIETALCWALQAKNSLDNVHGFSPAQLVFGQNPNVPTIHNSNPPALESEYDSDFVRKNLLELKLAREAFVQAESSERIKRALRYNIRPGGSNKFFNGDIVFYKRNDSRRWKGPGRVIGSESSNILIKHGSSYVRVHACRVMLEARDVPPIGEQIQPEETTCEQPRKKTKNTELRDNDSDTSADDVQDVSGGEQESEEKECEEEEDPENKVPGEEQESKDGKSEEEEKEEDGQDKESPKVIETPISTKVKIGLTIDYKNDRNEWQVGEVLSRAGKVGGKYTNCWNVKNLISGRVQVLDLKKMESRWRTHDRNENTTEMLYLNDKSHTIMMVSDEMEKEKLERLCTAKQNEMEKWQEEGVYQEVRDIGQDKISTTWVITEKMKDDKIVTKARLVARGYEEDKSSIRADSPTCMKDSVRVMLSIAAGKGWKIRSLDVKAAFLQGKTIEREVFLQPPVEFRQKGVLWKLKQSCVGSVRCV